MTADPAKVEAAKQALDAHVQEIVRWHFSEETGTPVWLQWARDHGCTEMASDRALTNDPSGHFHESIGYAETVRLVAYRKEL